MFYSKLSISELLDPMIALADERSLCFLGFFQSVPKQLEKLTGAKIVPGRPDPIQSVEDELRQYVQGKLRVFRTPIRMLGSLFQQKVWLELQKIPYGTTRTYSDIARVIEKPSAVRAVASAIGANRLAILIPCHRIIRMDGSFGGYNGGIDRKKWLLSHEKDREPVVKLSHFSHTMRLALKN